MLAKVAHSTCVCPQLSLTPNAKGSVQGPSPFIPEPSLASFIQRDTSGIYYGIDEFIPLQNMKQYISTDVSAEYPSPNIPLSGCFCLPPLASSLPTLIWHVTSAVSQSSRENQKLPLNAQERKEGR